MPNLEPYASVIPRGYLSLRRPNHILFNRILFRASEPGLGSQWTRVVNLGAAASCFGCNHRKETDGCDGCWRVRKLKTKGGC
mmetsp:Transcript_40176/g.93762  ORF Transcript_40176/g.93762 Transcript_40176/m.93762 type:complete len:82 (-) Transcript_40176:631-876(-)